MGIAPGFSKTSSVGFYGISNKVKAKRYTKNWAIDTLPETNSLPLKMDGWNTTFLLGRPIFRGYVSFREGALLSTLFLIILPQKIPQSPPKYFPSFPFI